MTDIHEFQEGDIIRWTLTAPFKSLNYDEGVNLDLGGCYSHYIGPEALKQGDFTLVSRAVTTFKPGDHVRHKVSGNEYILAENGYFSFKFGRVSEGAFPCTSENYELVSRG